MSKRTNTKYKIDRRMGESIWGRPKSPVNKRSYGPGQHGQRRAKKLSDYGTQLQAKQKLKGYYGNITERQFRKYYQEASRRQGDTGENMIGLLERRLDAVVYRSKFVPTPFAARQLVSHGHVRVNGRRLTVASFQVKAGDIVQIREKSRKQLRIASAMGVAAQVGLPEWVEVNDKEFRGVFKSPPSRDDILPDINENLVVELYSK